MLVSSTHFQSTTTRSTTWTARPSPRRHCTPRTTFARTFSKNYLVGKQRWRTTLSHQLCEWRKPAPKHSHRNRQGFATLGENLNNHRRFGTRNIINLKHVTIKELKFLAQKFEFVNYNFSHVWSKGRAYGGGGEEGIEEKGDKEDFFWSKVNLHVAAHELSEITQTACFQSKTSRRTVEIFAISQKSRPREICRKGEHKPKTTGFSCAWWEMLETPSRGSVSEPRHSHGNHEPETGSEEDVTGRPVAFKAAAGNPNASSESDCQGGPKARMVTIYTWLQPQFIIRKQYCRWSGRSTDENAMTQWMIWTWTWFLGAYFWMPLFEQQFILDKTMRWVYNTWRIIFGTVWESYSAKLENWSVNKKSLV